MSESHREFLLSALRAASLRARMFEVEINSIGIALKGGLVTPVEALQWVKDIGALELVGMIPDGIAQEAEK
jgi:hypothetical protein